GVGVGAVGDREGACCSSDGRGRAQHRHGWASALTPPLIPRDRSGRLRWRRARDLSCRLSRGAGGRMAHERSGLGCVCGGEVSNERWWGGGLWRLSPLVGREATPLRSVVARRRGAIT